MMNLWPSGAKFKIFDSSGSPCRILYLEEDDDGYFAVYISATASTHASSHPSDEPPPSE